jgi:hypothetical protein
LASYEPSVSVFAVCDCRASLPLVTDHLSLLLTWNDATF